MHVSAEIRWFWRDAAPHGLAEWFRNGAAHPCSAGGGAKRIDHYVRDAAQTELGIKRRGVRQGVEIKGLVAVVPAALAVGPFVGRIELWAKWISTSLDLSACATVAVEKRRWVRSFETGVASLPEIRVGDDEAPLGAIQSPGRWCHVELTSISVLDGAVWWTLGFEALGGVLEVEHDLRAVAALVAARRPPSLGDGLVASYPAWLTEHVLAA